MQLGATERDDDVCVEQDPHAQSGGSGFGEEVFRQWQVEIFTHIGKRIVDIQRLQETPAGIEIDAAPAAMRNKVENGLAISRQHDPLSLLGTLSEFGKAILRLIHGNGSHPRNVSAAECYFNAITLSWCYGHPLLLSIPRRGTYIPGPERWEEADGRAAEFRRRNCQDQAGRRRTCAPRSSSPAPCSTRWPRPTRRSATPISTSRTPASRMC